MISVDDTKKTDNTSITFVVPFFNGGGAKQLDGPNPYMASFENSVKKIYPGAPILIADGECEQYNDLYPEYFKEWPAAIKVLFQKRVVVDTEWVAFMDVDTLLLKPIDKYLKGDWVFTWDSEAGGVFINSGVMLCRNTPEVWAFWGKYWEKTLEYIKGNLGNDQHAFCELLGRKVDKDMSFVLDGVAFSAVSRDCLNNGNARLPLPDGCCVQHLKGILNTIIARCPKRGRFLKLERALGKLTQEERTNLAEKVNLWKSFAPPELADKVIDVENPLFIGLRRRVRL